MLGLGSPELFEVEEAVILQSLYDGGLILATCSQTSNTPPS
jgi:hypothetical protein